MKPLLKSLLLALVLCSLHQLSLCQSQQQNKSLHFRPPANINGLTPVKVDITYKVVNAFGSINLIADAKCTGDLVYQYKGREYTFSGGDAAVRNVKVTDPVIRVSITGPDGFTKEMNIGIVSGIGGGSFFGNSALIKEAKTKEEKDPANYTVTPLQVVSVSYEGGWDVQNFLDEKIRNEQKAVEIKSFIDNGDKAMLRQNYAEAENNYFKAQKLDKSNQYAASQIEKINKEKNKIQNKKDYDDLMSAAQSSEATGDFDNAERLYRKAGASGINDSYATNEANRVNSLKEKKIREIEEKVKKMNEKADKEQKLQNELNEKQDAETKKIMKEKEAYNRKIMQEKTDSIAESLAETERIKVQELQKKYYKDLEEEETRKEKEEKEMNVKEAADRRASDSKLLNSVEKNMAYDPEKYVESLQSANDDLDKALKIRPWTELQLKREWWDNNPYIQTFADDLYEKQRRENHWNYMKKQSEATGAFFTAKYSYIEAIKFVDRNSKQHKYLLGKIENCNKQIDFYESTWKRDFKGENSRIKFREQAKSMAIAQTLVNDNNKARMAYDVLEQSAEQPAQYLVKKYELAERYQQAEQKYQEDMAIAGVTNSVVASAMLNDNTSVAYVNKGTLINAFTSIGFGFMPMLMNETSDINTAKTVIDNITLVTTSVGLDWWVYRSRHIDFNIGGFGGIGLLPMKGVSAFYYNYGGKVNIDVGFKRFKIANTLEMVTRSGTQNIDYDVFNGSNTNSAAGSNRIGKGKFNYNTLRIGTGFKIDLNKNDETSHIWFNVFAEKPAFYPENIVKKPIFSYQLEWMGFSNLAINITYANNYAVAGERKYNIPERKNGDYFHFQFGKYWTILK